MAERVQLRGNCQVCGRLQAADPRLAKHGYTVEHGWFNGVCPGADWMPIQKDRNRLDNIMAEILRDCEQLEDKALKIEQGEYVPDQIVIQQFEAATQYRKERPLIMRAWADCAEHERKDWKNGAIYNMRARAGHGRSHREMMLALADKLHGQELAEVKVGAKEPIKAGDKIKVWGGEHVVTRVKEKAAWGVGPGINGKYVPHVYWMQDGKERSYPARYVRRV